MSDSRAGSVGVISGASTWLAGSTPVGAKYGSSQDHPYLDLRPFADAADTPSTATYTFRASTPPSGWTFVLGDVAASIVTSAGGRYSVPGFIATDGYKVAFAPPNEKVAVSALTLPANLTDSDAVVDFTV